MGGEARVKVSLREGVIELEGPQEFVEKQLEAFGDLIRASLEGRGRAGLQDANDPGEDRDIHGSGRDPAEKIQGNPYPELFAIKDKKVQILVDQMPGETDKSKTVNAALLTALGHEIAGVNKVPFETIREVCRQHGCLNEANFAKYVKEEQRLFVFGGTPKKQTAQLTVPGRTDAKKLAEGLARPGVAATTT